MPQDTYTRSDGKVVYLPQGADDNLIGQIIQHEEDDAKRTAAWTSAARQSTHPTVPPGLDRVGDAVAEQVTKNGPPSSSVPQASGKTVAGDNSVMGHVVGGLRKTKDWIMEPLALDTPASRDAFRVALSSGVFGPTAAPIETLQRFGSKDVSEGATDMAYSLGRNMTSPLNIALTAAAPVAEGVALLGEGSHIAPSIIRSIATGERLANLGLMGEGGYHMLQGAMDDTKSGWDRTKQFAGGLAEFLFSRAGYRHPSSLNALAKELESAPGYLRAARQTAGVETSKPAPLTNPVTGAKLPSYIADQLAPAEGPKLLGPATNAGPNYVERLKGDGSVVPTAPLTPNVNPSLLPEYIQKNLGIPTTENRLLPAKGQTGPADPRFYAGERGVVDTQTPMEAPTVLPWKPNPGQLPDELPMPQPVEYGDNTFQGTRKKMVTLDQSEPSRFEGATAGSPQEPQSLTLSPEDAAKLRAQYDPTLTGHPVAPPTDLAKDVFMDRLRSRMREAARGLMLRTGEPHQIDLASEVAGDASKAPNQPTTPRDLLEAPTNSTGSINTSLLTHLGTATAGGLAGATQGDTPADRIKNALIGMAMGAAVPWAVKRAGANEIGAIGSFSSLTKGEHPEVYSRLGQAIDRLPERSTVRDMLSRLKKQPFNPAEDHMVGVSEWLSKQDPAAKISREDIKRFFHENQLDLQEQEYTKGPNPEREDLRNRLVQARVARSNLMNKLWNEDPFIQGLLTPEGEFRTDLGMPDDQVLDLYEKRLSVVLQNSPEHQALDREVQELAQQLSFMGHPQQPLWEQYSLPGEGKGGDNYGNIVLKWNPTAAQRERIQPLPSHDDLIGQGYTHKEATDMLANPDKYDLGLAPLPDAHFDRNAGPGIVGWSRFHDRVDPVTGKKVRFIDEVQSDWMQTLEDSSAQPLTAAEQLEANQLRQRLEDLQTQRIAYSEALNRASLHKRDLVTKNLSSIEHLLTQDPFYRSARRAVMDLVYGNTGSAPTGLISTAEREALRAAHPDLVQAYVDYAALYHDPILNRLDFEIDNLLQNPIIERAAESRLTVPQAPFARGKMDWDQLLMRRLMQKAAKEGIDTVQWTTGEQQVQRWSEQQRAGMEQFYDRRLPGAVSKYGKRWGAAPVGKGEIRYTPGNYLEEPYGADRDAELLRSVFGDDAVHTTQPTTEPVHSFTMPEGMRKDLIEKGTELGFARPDLLARTAGGLLGGAIGATQGETTQDHIRNALIGAGIGIAAPSFIPTREIPHSPYLSQKMNQYNAEQTAALAGTSLRNLSIKQLPAAVRAKIMQGRQDFSDAFLDQLGPIGRKVKATVEQVRAAKAFYLAPEQDAYIQANLSLGGGGGQIANRIHDYRLIWRDMQEAGVESEAQAILNLRGFRAAWEALSGKAAAGNKDVAAKLASNTALPMGMNPAQIQAELTSIERAMGPKAFAKANAFADAILKRNQDIFEEAYKGGLLSEQVYQGVRARAFAGDYVPMMREIDNLAKVNPGSKLSLPTRNFWQKIKGSDRLTKHPIVGSMLRAQEVVKELNRNRAAKALYDMTAIDPAFKDWIKDFKPDPSWGELFYWDKGARKTFYTPSDVARAMNLATEREVRIIGSFTQKVLSFSGNLLRTSATIMNPAFAIANAIRDITDTAMLSKALRLRDVPAFAVEWGKAFKEAWNEGPAMRELMESRAGFSTLQRQLTPEHFQALRPASRINTLEGLYDAFLKIPDATESATKLATFKRLRAKGLTPDAAAWETRNYGGSPDFARHGYYGPEMSVHLMFLNAQIQGIARMSRVFKDPATLRKLALGTASIALGAKTWNELFTDADGTLSISRVKNSTKLNNIVLVNPLWMEKGDDGVERHGFITIPKGHTLKITLNPIEEILDQVVARTVGRDNPSAKSAGQIAADTVSNVLPGNFNLDAKDLWGSAERGTVASTNPLIQVPLALAMDRDPSFNTPILGGYEGREPAYQFDSRTSPTVRTMAKVAKGWGLPKQFQSPKQLQFALEKSGIKTGVGEIPFDIADAFVRKTQGTPRLDPSFTEAPTAALNSTPVIGAFTRRLLQPSTDQPARLAADEFYQLADRAKEAANTYNGLARVSPTEAREYANQGINGTLARYNGQLQKAVADLSKLRARKEAIRREYKNTPELRDQIRQIDAQINAALKNTDQVVKYFQGLPGYTR